VSLARAILGFTGIAFIGFGLAFTFWPESMGRFVDIGLPTATAKADFAATYGGFELGVGTFLLLCLRRPAWIEAGLLAGMWALLGFAAVRLGTVLVTGLPVRPAIWVALAMELAGVLLNLGGLRALRRSAHVP
jgi:hypothetical protein